MAFFADVGKIDKEFPQRGGQKFEDTGFKRMQQGFAEAYGAAGKNGEAMIGNCPK
jgi:hypothetical protein